MMTTPERLKRRQIREGFVLILLAIFTVVQAIYFNLEDRQQRDCVADKFSELTTSLERRSELVETATDLDAQESAAIRRIWMTYAEAAGLVKEDPTEELKPKDKARLQRELVANLLAYEKISKQVAEDRRQLQRDQRQNPVPPFPVGSCD